MDQLLLYELLAAYVRRQRFEATMIANAVGKMLMGGKGAATGDGGGRYRRVSADGLLKEMGVVIA